MKDYRFLEQKEINKQKWDALQQKYANGLPYANSWYLDAVCDNWNVIVYKDYEAGFAFQLNRKFGLSYSLHPFLVQQLGFFGEEEIVFKNILSIIETKVFHYHYQLNYFNSVNTDVLKVAVNHELIIDKEYKDLQSKYKTNTKRNLKNSYSNNLQVTIEQGFRQIDLEFVINNSKINFTKESINKFSKLMHSAHINSALEIYRIEYKEELIALTVFIKNSKRAVYLLGINSEKSKELKANFYLLDFFIKNNSGSSLILDLEGSNIEGISRFYKGFGAEENNYKIIKKNSFKNLIKKIL